MPFEAHGYYEFKLGIKGAGTLSFTLPYESIRSNPALKRFSTYTQRNTVSSESLGVLEDFMGNANARVQGTEFHSQFGIDYNVVGTQDRSGRPMLLFNMEYYNPQTRKKETSSKMIPYSPNDVNTLLDANYQIQSTIDNYIQKRTSYEMNN